MALRVLLADDHTLVRAGLRALLANLSQIEVVGEARTGREAVELAGELRPDVVLMDIAMPELNGLEAVDRIRRLHPEVRTIVLSMHLADEYIRHALRAGAAGYVLKDAGPAELETALHAVARGDRYLSPAVSRHVIDTFIDGSAAPDDDPLRRLTPRQREVLQLVAEGRSTKEIAQALDLSVKTVETHRAQIMDRLGIRDLAGLVRFAVRTGLVPPR